MVIDPDGAKFELAGEFHGAPDVVGPDGGGEAVEYVVAKTEGFGFVVEGAEGYDWSKDFALDDFVVLLDVGDDGWCEVVALFMSRRDGSPS